MTQSVSVQPLCAENASLGTEDTETLKRMKFFDKQMYVL